MKCLKCNQAEFITKNIPCNPEIKGKVIKITSAAIVCKNCDFSFMNTKQMDVLRKISEAKYKELPCRGALNPTKGKD